MTFDDFYINSQALTDSMPYQQYYQRQLSNSLVPPSQEVISQVRVLSPDLVERLWQPDAARSAYKKWLENHKARVDAADAIYQNTLQAIKQNTMKPYVFLRNIAQINFDVFQHFILVDCEAFFYTTELQEQGVSMEDFWRFSSNSMFENVRCWLSALQIPPQTGVYVARLPEETLLMSWKTLCEHWNGFCSAESMPVNVMSDDQNWFLFFHHEEVANYGCTADSVENIA